MNSSSAVPAMPKNMLLWLTLAVFTFYLGEGIYGTIFNNYLEQVHHAGTRSRTLLEIPRELPGIISVFAVVALYFFGEVGIAITACFLLSAGLFGLAFQTTADDYWSLSLWIAVASLGQHIFMVIIDAIVLHSSSPQNRSLRLGQMKSLENVAALTAAGFIWIKWEYFNRNFTCDLVLAAICAGTAGFMLNRLRLPGHFIKCGSWRERLVFRRQYSLYYVLEAFFGARKQVFLTFGFWLLVSNLNKSPAYIGKLMLIAGIIGIGFRPFIGKVIQVYGERFTLITESVLLVLICLVYALALLCFSLEVATLVISACFIADASLFAFGMARPSYLAHQIQDRRELTPSLYTGMAVNHVTSILGAICGGVLWKITGSHVAVFLFAALLAVMYGVSATRVPQLKKNAS